MSVTRQSVLWGQARALMHEPPVSTRWRYMGDGLPLYGPLDDATIWRAQMCMFLLHVSQWEPAFYQEQLLPYLASFVSHWRHPLAEVDATGIRNQPFVVPNRSAYSPYSLMKIAPFARFAFHVNSNAWNGRTFRQGHGFPMLEGFSHVSFLDHFIRPAGVANMVKSSVFEGVTHLALYGCCIGDEGLEMLSTASCMQNLELLDVSGCQITDAGVVAMCKAHAFPLLRVFRMRQNSVTEKGCRALLDSGMLSMLDEFVVQENPVSVAMQQKLAVHGGIY